MLTVKIILTIYTIWLFYRLGIEWRHVRLMHLTVNHLKGNRMRNQKGFTLIELIVVIVILGIMAACVTKFVDLSSEAKTATAAGVAGVISSSAAVNYAGRMATVGASTRKGVAHPPLQAGRK